jgi:DNA-binding transcriptional LysR family regulator
LVSLQTTCALTLTLLEGFHAGLYDIVLVKRAPSQASADALGVWQEPLVWVCDRQRTALSQPLLPLVVAPEPCVHRKRAIEALARANLNWRLSYVCESQSGLKAAVAEGLGVSVLPASAASGLHIVEEPDLPVLDDVEIALMTAEPLSPPAQMLASFLRTALSEGRVGRVSAL